MENGESESLGVGGGAMRVSRVISVCEARDIDVWKTASRHVARNIDADSYQLICPDHQIAEFVGVSAPCWQIVGENRLNGDECLALIRQRVRGENIHRVHWLYQQFLKINAIRGSELGDDAVVLIWDADTIPLRRLDFIEPKSGSLVYYHGREHHAPYFETIGRLLGHDRVAGVSFIAQCMPLQVGWVREMCSWIENRFGTSFEESVLAMLPGLSGSEFSEYETLGSWCWHHHRGEMIMRVRNRWMRNGVRWLGADTESPKARLVLRLIACHYDYVAVEKWCRPVTFRRVFNYIKRHCAGSRTATNAAAEGADH